MKGEPIPSSFKASSHWPDGSVKWAIVRAVLCAETDSPSNWELRYDTNAVTSTVASHPQTLKIEHTSDYVTVQDAELSYRFEINGHKVFPDVYSAENQTWIGDDFRIETKGIDNKPLEFEKTGLNVVAQDAVSALVTLHGTIAVSVTSRLEVSLRFEILSGCWMRLGVCIHNPHRAQHPGSLWDLGDDGSIKLDEFALRIARKSTDRVKFRSEPQLDWTVCDSSTTTLFQASSGGKHWDSPNHVDALGNVCNKFKGYRVENEGALSQQGNRASPVLWVNTTNGSHFGVTVAQYWQNFPKCLTIHDTSIKIGLFPAEHGSAFELQGGERKHHDVVFSFADGTDSLQWVDKPISLTVPTATITESRVLRYAQNTGGKLYSEIIAKSLCVDTGFFAKREIIDEFGWRNFGDIYADHETLYHDSNELFVSHYNNQYDAIYGFGRQYLLTGDARWYRLMVELARHVLDIDIYRTQEDRAEYNHGLFWHTDHYKQAYTCTHRTYSKEHYIDWQGDKGGGPGSEHCYTSGLVLYYQLTGDTDAYDAVVGLARWVSHFFEGTGTLLETCKNIVTKERRDFLSLCKGRHVLRYKYALDRGTGNYMRALLDSFEVTGEKLYITRTEEIFMASFACNDDLAARDLDNPEHTWFYSIFLQEIIRYLDLKRSLNEFDAPFRHARHGLLYYVRWMVENETPYLSRPERLEYPNDTWVAQDIRKANVFYAAYRYAVDDRDILLIKARYFRDYVLQSLTESDTVHFARMQILMLQNHGPSGLMDTRAEPYTGVAGTSAPVDVDQSCFLTWPGLMTRVMRQLLVGIRTFSLTREMRWVRARLG